jgi:P-type conjugative transfer protein TrbJ
MRRVKQTLATALCLTVLTSVAAPRKAQAQFAVFDAVNWVENALQVIQQAYEIYQKYMQLYNDYQRYATMVKNLERFDELTFQNLVGLAAAVNDIIQYGESLGHTLYDIDAQFAETFPGYEPILEDDWLEVFEHRNRRTLDTLRYSLNALNRISWNSIPAQEILEGLAADAAAADGNVEALQAANELLHHQASQLAKISQQISLEANVQAVYWAYQVDREAADRATTSQWIANGVGEVPPYESATAVRGVPSDWPWPCYGCRRSAVEGSR